MEQKIKIKLINVYCLRNINSRERAAANSVLSNGGHGDWLSKGLPLRPEDIRSQGEDLRSHGEDLRGHSEDIRSHCEDDRLRQLVESNDLLRRGGEGQRGENGGLGGESGGHMVCDDDRLVCEEEEPMKRKDDKKDQLTGGGGLGEREAQRYGKNTIE
jgi:hypothetical protein